MNTNYQKINFSWGSNIENAVEQLLKHKEQGILACGNFNGTILYSDTVTLDSAYKEIIGKTKDEYDQMIKVKQENRNKAEQDHKEKIPSLSEEWMKKGRKILTDDKWQLWDKIVPIRLGDLYHGMELGCSLDIIEILNNNGTLEEAKEMIDNQNHSGMSFGLVCSMVKEFCLRGKEFVDFVR